MPIPTTQPYVPPKVAPPVDNPSTKSNLEEAMKSPEFREAKRKNEEDEKTTRPVASDPNVKKTDPMTSADREAAKAHYEEGY